MFILFAFDTAGAHLSSVYTEQQGNKLKVLKSTLKIKETESEMEKSVGRGFTS